MAITVTISGSEAGGAENGGMDWAIDYDDQTRDVTAHAEGRGKCVATIQVTDTLSRQVAFLGPAANLDGTAGPMTVAPAGTDYTVPVADGQPPFQVLESGIQPNRVSKIVGKAGGTGGFPSTSTWSRS